MIDVGGPNLPRSVSTKLGGKLGQIYNEKGITSLEPGLIKSFKVLRGKPTVTRKEDSIEIKVLYQNDFCPLGGKYNPDSAELIQKSLCIPYYLGFVNKLNPEYNYKINVNECILCNNTKTCKFTLKLTKKEKK